MLRHWRPSGRWPPRWLADGADSAREPEFASPGGHLTANDQRLIHLLYYYRRRLDDDYPARRMWPSREDLHERFGRDGKKLPDYVAVWLQRAYEEPARETVSGESGDNGVGNEARLTGSVAGSFVIIDGDDASRVCSLTASAEMPERLSLGKRPFLGVAREHLAERVREQAEAKLSGE